MLVLQIKICTGRCHLRDLGEDGRVILKWIIQKSGARLSVDSTCPGEGSVAGCGKHGNETSDSIEDDVFIDQLSNYQPL
jgi:hypothetical protein